jgi:hypothetical protein
VPEALSASRKNRPLESNQLGDVKTSPTSLQSAGSASYLCRPTRSLIPANREKARAPGRSSAPRGFTDCALLYVSATAIASLGQPKVHRRICSQSLIFRGRASSNRWLLASLRRKLYSLRVRGTGRIVPLAPVLSVHLRCNALSLSIGGVVVLAVFPFRDHDWPQMRHDVVSMIQGSRRSPRRAEPATQNQSSISITTHFCWSK